MKRIALGFLSVMLLCPAANATGINILSETNHIWGIAGDDYSYLPGESYETYDHVSNHAISASASGYYYSEIGLEFNKSTASAGDFAIALEAGRWAAAAFGESTYTFTSDYNKLSLSASGYVHDTNLGDDKVLFSLLDLSTGNTIYNYLFKSYYDQTLGNILDFSFSSMIDLNSNHTYQLHMYAEVTGSDNVHESGLTVNMSSQPVPEPATLLLMSTGIAGLIGLRRKKKV